MALFDKILEAKIMSTHLLIRANVSKKILLQAYKIAKDFEDRYSAYKKNSFLNQINNCAGTSNPLPCTPQDNEIFSKSILASQQTNGLFDITIGALSHGAYHFGFDNQKIASEEEIKKRKSLINYKNIILKNNTISLKIKNMRLDLGGIGKGFVSKQIALFLQKQGATRILVDVGGEIITLGKKFTIAIKNPFKEGNIGYIETTKAPLSISTSGNYERFIDQKNHHILHTKQGISSHFYSSITILQNGWNIDMLDAYATALFNQPHQEMHTLAKKLKLSTITINNTKEIMLSSLDALKLEKVTLI